MILALLSLCGACASSTPIVSSPPSAPVKETQQPVAPVGEFVSLEALAANRYVLADKDDEVLVRLRVTAETLPGVERPAANLALVIDTSASMRGEAIDNARSAALAMLDGLSEGDRISIVTFHSRAEVVVPSTVISEASLPDIRGSVEQIQATGTTALAAGLQSGLGQVAPHRSNDAVSRVVLLSDGIPNDAAQMPNVAARAKRDGIAITAFGLGSEYDETLLAQLALHTGGRFHNIESPDAVAQMFRDEVLHIDRLVARRSTLSVACGPGVTVTEMLGRPEVAPGSRQATLELGALAENETKDVVLRLQVTGRSDGSTVELLDASLRYQDAITGTGGLGPDAFLAASSTADADTLRSGADPQTELIAARAIAAGSILSAMQMARAGDVKGATTLLRKSQKKAHTLATQTEDEALQALVDEIAELRKTIHTLAPPKVAQQAPKKSLKGMPMPEPEPMGMDEAMQPEPSSPSIKRGHSAAFNELY